MFAPAYLDYNATAPLRPEVLEAMLPFLGGSFGNASSRHEYGRQARRAVDEARQRVAVALGAHPTEVIFVSGGSEANNLFLKGAAARLRAGLLACSAVEHPSVREAARDLVRAGWAWRELPVDESGRVRCDDYVKVVGERPALVSIMAANNETGALQDVAALAEAAKPAGTWFHTDAVQTFGRLPLDFRALNRSGVHGMTVSAHKIGGPKGAGALVADKRLELSPLIAGGGQERGLRSGTENVAALVGFGVACELAVARLTEESARQRLLRAQLERGLAAQGATVFAAAAERLPNTAYFAFPGLDGETLVSRLDRAGFAVASGSACASASPEPSFVLSAMGVAPELARGAVRVSLGAGTTEQEIGDFLQALVTTVTQLRGLVSLAA